MNETGPEQKKRRILTRFLSSIRKDAQALYILGDLFDFWFEWYHVVPKYYFPVFHALRSLVDSGTRVYLLAGNHDFYFQDYIHQQVGLLTSLSDMTPTLGNKRFYLAHGDGLGKKDTGYKVLKKLIRNRISIFVYKTFLPADLGMWIAKVISGGSRRLKNIDRSRWMREYYLDFARKKWNEGFDYVILGHIHYPGSVLQGGHTLACPGDFITHFSYLMFNGIDLVLKNTG